MNKRLFLNFYSTAFDVEEGSTDCDFDYVEIQSLQYCGYTVNKGPKMQTGPDPVMLKFHSDSAVERTGFKIEFSAVAPITTTQSPITPASDTCGMTFNLSKVSDSVIFHSPQWPLNYPNNADCRNVINNKAFAQNMAVKLTILELVTEQLWDKLQITDANGNMSILQGTVPSGSVEYFFSPQLKMEFTSDGSTNYAGYQIRASLGQKPVDCPGQYRCKSGNQCIPQTQRCDGIPQCDDGSDEKGSMCPGKKKI